MTLKLVNVYWKVHLARECKLLTAFTVSEKGLFQSTVMPFELSSAGETIKRLLGKVTGPELDPDAFANFNYLVLVSSFFEERNTENCFKLLKNAGLKSDKC